MCIFVNPIAGPGPHKIDSEENHEEANLDFKLLPQRDQSTTNN